MRELEKQGRNFNCKKCPVNIQKKRRCLDDRWDFTEEDDPIFPIYVTKGGQLFGFCPAKATWDESAVNLFRAMMTCHQSGSLWVQGAVSDQPSWFVDLFSWFSSQVDDVKFFTRARAILGDGSSGNKSGKPNGQSRR